MENKNLIINERKKLMKKSKNKILAIMLVIIFILNFALPVLVETSVVLAAAATDYDFRNELNADRVGIGFTWTAATRTLTITEIKNNNAEIKLPENSTIDIQGNIENEIKKIESDGSLTIKGNNVASLNIDRIILDSENKEVLDRPWKGLHPHFRIFCQRDRDALCDEHLDWGRL